MSKVRIVMLISVMLLLTSSASALNSTGKHITVSTLPLSSVSSGGGSSGGGYGGGGVVTDEPYSNIANSDRKEQDLRAGQMAVYNFNLDIYKVELIPQTNEFDVMVKVEMLKGKSARTSTAPEGEEFQYFNLYAGTVRIGIATIFFTVPSDNTKTVKKMRYIASSKTWQELELTQLDDTHYSAKTKAFSNFAIVRIANKGITTEATTAVSQQTGAITETSNLSATPTPEQTEQPAPKTPGFGATTGVISLISAIYIARKRKP